MIALPHRLPASPTERPDPDDGAGPSGAPTTTRPGHPTAVSPGKAGLVALVKLIARQAAEEDFTRRGEMR